MPDNDPHPAIAGIDPAVAARRFHVSLTGGPHWDDLMVSLHPHMGVFEPSRTLHTLEACIDDGLMPDLTVEHDDPVAVEALRLWTERRAPLCAQRLATLPIVDGHVRAHRMIGVADPSALRPALGVFWTHDFENWPDPYALWAEGGRDAPTLVVEAMVPVAAIDWQVSCMALMDWYCGDCEAELRLLPGHPLRVVSAFRLENDAPVALPDLTWTS